MLKKGQPTFGTFPSSNTQADTSACKRAKSLPSRMKNNWTYYVQFKINDYFWTINVQQDESSRN